MGELQLRHPVGIMHRLCAGRCVRPGAVLAGHRIRFDGLRRLGRDRIGQPERLPARRGLHGHRPALHDVRITGRIGFVVHRVLLLAERGGRHHSKKHPHSASPLGHSRFRIRVQSEPAQWRHPGAVRRGPHSHPGCHLQRRDRDEFASADPADHRRRGASVRPGGRLPTEPTQRARCGQLTARLRLRAPRGPLRNADSARPVPGFDVLPDRHRHPPAAAAADHRAVPRTAAGDHVGSSDAGPGGDRL